MVHALGEKEVVSSMMSQLLTNNPLCASLNHIHTTAAITTFATNNNINKKKPADAWTNIF